MKTLTRAEEQIMQVLWKIKTGFLKDIVDAMPEPKPHSNTVATLLKILVEKEFVSTEVFGRMNQYKSDISKESYFKKTMNGLVKGYFDGSFTEAVSCLVEDKKISIADLELLLKQLKKTK